MAPPPSPCEPPLLFGLPPAPASLLKAPPLQALVAKAGTKTASTANKTNFGFKKLTAASRA